MDFQRLTEMQKILRIPCIRWTQWTQTKTEVALSDTVKRGLDKGGRNNQDKPLAVQYASELREERLSKQGHTQGH